MRAAAFRVARHDTLEGALATLAEFGDEARVIAGGQSLGPMMALRLAAPAVLVDVAAVPELRALTVGGGHLPSGAESAAPPEAAAQGPVVVGAMVRQRDVERHAGVGVAAPLLAEAIPNIGHEAIRNRGTVCGSLAHADPAAELPAAAVAAGATLHLRSASGSRVVRADDFFTGYYGTAVEPGELVEAVEWPAIAPGTGTAFVELSRRHGDFALVGVAAVVGLDAEQGTVHTARIALSGVGSTSMRARAAEAVLAGAPAGEEVIAAAAAAVLVDIDPHDDLHGTAAYRRHLAVVLTRRALRLAVDRAGAAA